VGSFIITMIKLSTLGMLTRLTSEASKKNCLHLSVCFACKLAIVEVRIISLKNFHI
jgi:hypothetical protein